MTPELTLDLITALAAAFWLVDLVLVVRAGRRRTRAPATGVWLASDGSGAGGPSSAALSGEVHVPGATPEALSARARDLLARGQAVQPLSTARIDRVESATIHLDVRLEGGGGHTAGRLAFEPERGGTRVVWEYDTAPGRVLLIAARWVVVAALVLLVGLHLALRTQVLTLPVPLMRWHVVHMLHVVHLLWPPLLFVGLRRGLRTGLQRATEVFVTNLPHARAAG